MLANRRHRADSGFPLAVPSRLATRWPVVVLAVWPIVQAAVPHAVGADAELPNVRPHPQIVQPSPGPFRVTAETRIVVPAGWPAYIRVSAQELAATIQATAGVKPEVTEVERPDFKKGNITVGPYEWFAGGVLPWIEPAPQGINRPVPPEGYNVRILPEYVALAGNSERGCFMGLQTLIQIARQTPKAVDGAFSLPGVFIADWPDHAWRTLQHPFGVYGTAYERGEHFYRHITRVDLLERSVRLAAHHKLTGLVVEVGTGMKYDRHPEMFVEGFATNDKDKVRAAVDLAKSLGMELTPFQNASACHDIWFAPYPYAAQDSDIFMEELFDVFDETLEVFRPVYFHIGMDEDVARDFDEIELRKAEIHKRVILDCYNFLRRRGVKMLVWNDGITLIQKDQTEIPRDVIVLPWYYGGGDFTPLKQYIDMGFRVLCSPWSQWHVENDQFYSLCAASLKSEKVLGMAGTVWYPISSDPDGENDYRRCLVKAAMAFWSPMQAGDYPNDKSYLAPAYAGLPGDALSKVKARPIPDAELPGLVSLVTGPDSDHFACEAARERLAAAGTAVVPALTEAMSRNPQELSAWAEGTLRRIAREPAGDPAAMVKALETAAASTGALRALAIELLGACNDTAFLAKQDVSDPAVAYAMGVSRDRGFVPGLLKAAATSGPAQVNALTAIGRLKGVDELLNLKGNWKSFDDKARESYARALAMQASEAAIPVLGDLAADVNWRVRFRAAIGLGATRSAKAGPYILKLLGDKHPAVFKVALWWCTDTFILKPEEYFPKLAARLTLDEDKEIVRPILHMILLMKHPQMGCWLAKGEDPARHIDYDQLSVWKDPSLAAAVNRMLGYNDPRLAMDAVSALLNIGGGVNPETVIAALDKFSIEDKRWFCVKMREDRTPEAVPILRKLWDTNDHLVQTFILQYAGRVPVQAAFDLASEAYSKLPDSSQDLKIGAVGAMAAHLTALDAKARHTVPLILDLYEKVDLNSRLSFDATLCRVAGREPLKTWDNDPAWFAKRLADWKEWWTKQAQ